MSGVTACETQHGGNSGFLNLPSEIRIQIYRYLFKDTSVGNYADWEDDWKPCLSPVISILFTCKLCYGEAKSTFYGQTTLHLKDSVTINDVTPSYSQMRTMLGRNAQHVRYIHYYGEDHKFVFQIQETFPNLKEFDMHLGEAFCHSDQLNFDRALRYVLRYGDWKTAIKDALDERFGGGMRDAFARLRHLGPQRGFTVTMRWFMAYRFLDFEGDANLDEWVLRIRDPERKSWKVYEIRQNPLEPTWCESRLTLPCAELDIDGLGE